MWPRLDSPAKHDLCPRQQLLLAEWLTDVIVGASVQRCDALALPAACCEGEDRHLTPLAQPAYHLHCLRIAGSEVEQDDVGSTLIGFPQSLGRSRHLDQAESVRQKRPSE